MDARDFITSGMSAERTLVVPAERTVGHFVPDMPISRSVSAWRHRRGCGIVDAVLVHLEGFALNLLFPEVVAGLRLRRALGIFFGVVVDVGGSGHRVLQGLSRRQCSTGHGVPPVKQDAPAIRRLQPDARRSVGPFVPAFREQEQGRQLNRHAGLCCRTILHSCQISTMTTASKTVRTSRPNEWVYE